MRAGARPVRKLQTLCHQGVLFGDEPSGERALERSTVCRCSVRQEHDLDRPFRWWDDARWDVTRETHMAAPTTVDEYLAGLPDERRAAMEALRQAINAGAPEATETIAYAMPALRSHGGQFLVSYDAYKHHYSLFPASEAVVEELGEQLTPYLSGKGTIRFPADKPIPASLVTRIVRIRFAENAARNRR